MTEKRFICDDDMIYDNLTNRALCNPCELLNMFDKANKQLNGLILDIIDLIKENDGVTREEFADWWNRRVME